VSPESTRAWATIKALNIQWHVAGEAISATVSALEEVEHMRPVVEAAKAVNDAISGEARAQAVVALLEAVAKLRGSGR